MKSILYPFLVILFALLETRSVTHADLLLRTIPIEKALPSPSIPGTYGWSFTVGTNDIRISHLGVSDYLDIGLPVSTPVGVWDSDDTLLTQLTVPSGKSAAIDSMGYRYKILPTPLTLTKGKKYYLGVYYGNYTAGFLAISPSALAKAGAIHPAITFISGEVYYGSSLHFPNRTSNTDYGYFSANARFILSLPTNHPPTDLALSSSEILENQPVGTAVGTFSTVDSDLDDRFTYTLVSGSGDTNNGAFAISGDLLKTATSFNYELVKAYSIRVRTTDQAGLYFEKDFMIGAIDQAEPTPILQTPEVRTNGTIVLRWSSVTGHTYSILCSTNLSNGFSVLQNGLSATPPFNSSSVSVEAAQTSFWRISTEP